MSTRKRVYTLKADGSVKVADLANKSQANFEQYQAQLYVDGLTGDFTFGSGTLTVQTSPDATGARKADLLDGNGAAITFGSTDAFTHKQIQLALPSVSTDAPSVWLTLSGATSPDIEITIID